MKRTLLSLFSLLLCLVLLVGCDFSIIIPILNNQTTVTTGKTPPPATIPFDLSLIPAFSGEAWVEINFNRPFFEEKDKTTTSFENFTPLDSLGRCGVAYAAVGRDLMPTEDRGDIGSVKPSGWHSVQYDCVSGKNLYNRCHLIGFQLTGENANKQNLITGTRFLNIQGMLPFEDMVADYVKETNNHVLYRVTPIFEGNNLVASGVLMEGYSVEDNGEGVEFCVYCYNAQPQVVIDYLSGESHFDPTYGVGGSSVGDSKADYVLNTSSKKFHLPSCSSVGSISEANRQDVHTSREQLIADGYKSCGSCNP